MVGPSKILTVSYGTFSCTLEGFDDPFSTMRGIAEYFRDLAADDRYFGAEPPIPDAEMLHRIAQSDVEKNIVSQVEDNGIRLRQVEEETAMPPVPELVAAQEAPVTDPFIDEPADLMALNEPSQVDTESVAAKLARIRAVVSHDTVATEEDETEEAYISTPISAAFEDANEGEQAYPDTKAPDTEPTNIEPIEFQETEISEEASVDPAETAAEEQQASEEPTLEGSVSDVLQTTGEETLVDSVEDADVTETEIDEPALDETISEFMGDAADVDPEDDASDGSDDPDSSTISRIIKMRRSDFDAAQESSLTDSDYEDTEDNTSSLSAEDEAELMANLEQVQRKADAEERAEKEGRALLENQDIEASADSVTRILDVTNNEMEETEGTRRRSAIAHLKAAVAATRADRFLSRKRKEDEEEDLNQYRDDLAKVVKPKRPVESGKTARQAPLMLVSEQRVDEPMQEVALDGASVLPRRVSAGNLALNDDQLDASEADQRDNMFVENNTFAEFAKEMGARELPDLLEAAAAYSAYVEGQEHFSRPQIMQAVAAIREEEFSREEGLRSFGLLLRRGKIKKLKRGQFAVAETTRFQPQSRAVGE